MSRFRSTKFPTEPKSRERLRKQCALEGWLSGSASTFGPSATSRGLCQYKWFMNPEDASQALLEFASIVVKTSSRCSTFASSIVIHRASSNPGSPGKTLSNNRVK